MAEFTAYPLAPFLQARLAERGFTDATPIQDAALGPLLEGQDAVLHSPTGSGKTLAYLLPVLSGLDATQSALQAVVVSPSRELAMQIHGEIQAMTRNTEIVSLPLIGGANLRHQVDRLKRHPQIVVGTPGRLAELKQAGKLKLGQVRYLVVDEIDQCVKSPFREDLIKLLKGMGRDRQTIWASATLGPDVEELASRWLKDPARLDMAAPLALPETLTHARVVTETRDKLETLRKLLHAVRPKAALVFVNDPFRGGEIAAKLAFKGLEVGALSGEATKADRAGLIKDFRSGKVAVLVSTELAARGLDLPGLTHVFNFELPTDAAHYLHRAGRTGRLGQPGTVVSLVDPRECFVVGRFEDALGVAIADWDVKFGEVVEAAPTPAAQPVAPRKPRPTRTEAAPPAKAPPAKKAKPKKLDAAKSAEKARLKAKAKRLAKKTTATGAPEAPGDATPASQE